MRVYNITFDSEKDTDKVKIYDNGKKVFDGIAFSCFLLKDGLNQREIANRCIVGDTTIFILKPEAAGQ